MALLTRRHDPITLEIQAAAKRGFFDRLEPFEPTPLKEFFEIWAKASAMSEERRIAYLRHAIPGESPGRASLFGKPLPARSGRRRVSLRNRR